MEVNRELDKKPELINQSSHGVGWICKIQPEKRRRIKNLMNKEEYEVFLKNSMKKVVRVLVDPPLSGYENMSRDEALLEMASDAPLTLRFFE